MKCGAANTRKQASEFGWGYENLGFRNGDNPINRRNLLTEEQWRAAAACTVCGFPNFVHNKGEFEWRKRIAQPGPKLDWFCHGY